MISLPMTKQKRLQLMMLVIGIPAMAVAGWYAYGDIQRLEAPPLWALAPALAANLISVALSARSWSVLLDDMVPRQTLDDAFYTSQLMKYTPVGGVAQAVSQAALARTDEVGLARAGTAMVLSKLTTVISAGVFGPLLALSSSSLPGWIRLGLLATPAVLILGRRPLMAWSLERLRGIVPKVPDHTVLPTQRQIWWSVTWCAGSLAMAGVTFAVLAITAGLGVNWVQATAGFAISWAVGFLVIPIPAGLGVREAALGLLVAGNPGAVLVSAVLFRGVAIVTEGLLFAQVRLRARFGRVGRQPQPSSRS